MCTTRRWYTGISAAYVSEYRGLRPACNSPGLKANILIDEGGRAYLAGFSQLVMVSDQSTITSLTAACGAVRWMSPELFNPDGSDLGNPPTKESDCYALGMVIYEALSGQAPYAPFNQLVAVQKILAGERPNRPRGTEGAWFTNGLWRMLELCWKAQPADRPSPNAVLRCLQGVTKPLEPHGVDSRSDATAGDAVRFHCPFPACP